MIGLISAKKARRISESHDHGFPPITMLKTWKGMRYVNRCIRDAANGGGTYCNIDRGTPDQVIELLKQQGYEVQKKCDIFSGTYYRIFWGWDGDEDREDDGDREGDEDREPGGDT